MSNNHILEVICLEEYFIPYKNRNGCVVDWNFQSIIHCLSWHNGKDGYVETDIQKDNGQRIKILMHRLLMGFPEEVDHINGIKNNNQKNNLRSVTHRQNNQNNKYHREGKLIGTCFENDRNKWKSCIQINGKNINLGRFDTEIEAHNAYMKKLNKIRR